MKSVRSRPACPSVQKLIRKTFNLFLTLTLVFSAQAVFAYGKFPHTPELKQTPGVLCENSGVTRYPEHIEYCERDVSSNLKRSIIAKYDQVYGYSIQSMNRGDFKIDHFIPLSIGGANAEGNLWPQHRSVYSITDPIELELSILIKSGKIKQADAIRAIKEVKLDLTKARSIMMYLKSLE